ncbi:uncharacterized protein LOC143846158 [Tasmannia lanceolata]|uniref:uncharacterized protein LOC143846158 n=1 Tax=Tasmannia lanceolata TaxID=3420 RepID=UPI00406393D9
MSANGTTADGTTNKEKNVMARCCPYQFNEEWQRLKGKLKDDHWNLLNKTPFRHLFELGGIPVYKTLLGCLVSLWDSRTNCFTLGGESISFDVSDVALALGLSTRGEIISYNRSRTTNIAGWRFRKPSASRMEIVSMINCLVVNDDKESIELTVKLLLLLLFSTVLFTQTEHKVHRSLFPYIDNIGSTCNFAWAYAVYDDVIEHLNALSTTGKGHLAGCSIVLQVWIFEHTTLWTSSDPVALPRLFKWKTKLNTTTLVQKNLIKLLEDKQLNPSQVVRTLTPLGMEVALLPPTCHVVGEEVIDMTVNQRVAMEGVQEQPIPKQEPYVEYPTEVFAEQGTTLDVVEEAERRAIAVESELWREKEKREAAEKELRIALQSTEEARKGRDAAEAELQRVKMELELRREKERREVVEKELRIALQSTEEARRGRDAANAELQRVKMELELLKSNLEAPQMDLDRKGKGMVEVHVVGEESQSPVEALDAQELEGREGGEEVADIVDVRSQSIVAVGNVEQKVKVGRPRRDSRFRHTPFTANKKRKVVIIKEDVGTPPAVG